MTVCGTCHTYSDGGPYLVTCRHTDGPYLTRMAGRTQMTVLAVGQGHLGRRLPQFNRPLKAAAILQERERIQETLLPMTGHDGLLPMTGPSVLGFPP